MRERLGSKFGGRGQASDAAIEIVNGVAQPDFALAALRETELDRRRPAGRFEGSQDWLLVWRRQFVMLACNACFTCRLPSSECQSLGKQAGRTAAAFTGPWPALAPDEPAPWRDETAAQPPAEDARPDSPAGNCLWRNGCLRRVLSGRSLSSFHRLTFGGQFHHGNTPFVMHWPWGSRTFGISSP